MLNEASSNELWDILKTRAFKNRLYEFSARAHGVIAVTIETFTVKRKLEGGRIEVKRNYYRMVRDEAGSVLYDQLEDVTSGFVDRMAKGGPIPDIAISPGRANSLLRAVLEQQAEVDRLIAGAK